VGIDYLLTERSKDDEIVEEVKELIAPAEDLWFPPFTAGTVYRRINFK